MSGPTRLLLGSGNPGKLREYGELAAAQGVDVAAIPDFASLPAFAEDAPTFAENAAGKALHYSRIVSGLVIADDSGLMVPALAGAPGVHSARYAGAGAQDSARVAKLLAEMRSLEGSERLAYFVCVLVLAQNGTAGAVLSESVLGSIAGKPRGNQGFGYDPVFYYPPLERTFAEMSSAEKNRHSHRGKAFGKLLAVLKSPQAVI